MSRVLPDADCDGIPDFLELDSNDDGKYADCPLKVHGVRLPSFIERRALKP